MAKRLFSLRVCVARSIQTMTTPLLWHNITHSTRNWRVEVNLLFTTLKTTPALLWKLRVLSENFDMKMSIEGLHGAVRTYMCTILPCPVVSFLYSVVLRKTNKTPFYFWIPSWQKLKFQPSVCTIIFVTICNIGIMVWTQLKVSGHFLVFSYTTACEEETNMVVESSMTRKLAWYDIT